MESRDEPSGPAGRTKISIAPAVSERTFAAMRSIIVTSGCVPGSAVDHRRICAARAKRGASTVPAAPRSERRLIFGSFVCSPAFLVSIPSAYARAMHRRRPANG
jgi:hypothetical protein